VASPAKVVLRSRPQRVHSHSTRRRRRSRPGAVFLGALTAFALVLMSGAQARAAVPTPKEIESQISKIWATAEPEIEKYNQVHEDYRKNKAKQTALEKKIDPLQRELDLSQIRVGAISAQVYKGGQANAFNAVLTSGSPDVLADQLSILDQLAREQQRQVSGVTELKAKFDTQRAPIDALVAKLADQDKDLAAKKKSIEAQLSKLQELRRQAYGTTGAVGNLRPWVCPSEYLPTPGYKAAKFACNQAGDPYIYATAGPNSYDCSGLTLAAWSQVGVNMPHNAAQQRASMPYVKRADLQIGDLVFYYSGISHVAIYVGNGKVMQAPSAGDVVRMSDMDAVGPIHSYGRPNG
jgi:peptidoglycan DL-endopeptidase CwlO